MTITPSSNIILLKTPMELSDNNQLTWSTLNEQYNYFSNLPKLELDDATYQRKEGVIRFPTNNIITYEDLIQYNYCMYQNEAYDNKWFYAYITEINYVNDGMSTIKLETDVWNTWWNDITFKKSFVEREHVNDDTIGLHTIMEDLDTGEMICNDIASADLGLLWYVVGVTKTYQTWGRGGGIYNGIYSGKTYYAMRTTSDLETFIQSYETAGYADDVCEVFIVPAKLIGNPTYSAINPVYTIPQSANIEQLVTITSSRPTSINTYTPRNKKLLVYPYQYLLVDNNGGNSTEYHYELFNSPSSIQFKIIGSLTIGTSMSLLPIAYSNANGNSTITSPNMFNYGMSLAKYPVCNWNTDVYTNWLTQNAVNMQMNVIGDIGKGITTGMSGGIIGSAFGAGAGAIKGITENMVQRHNYSFSPNQAKGNANAGDVITSGNANAPHFYKMSIKKEFAKILDNYFDMFGYKINDLKIPNLTGRKNWNYIKTIGCNLIGDIPQFDLQKIKELFDKGITLWHNTLTFLDYSQSNTIIS